MTSPTTKEPVRTGEPGPDGLSGRGAAMGIAVSIAVVVLCAVVAIVAVRISEPHGYQSEGAAPLGAFPARAPYGGTSHATAPDSTLGAQMATYGWVDEGGGIVAIPIDEAMRILAAADSSTRDDR